MTKLRAKYRGNYAARSRGLRAAAYANPATRCWRCGRTLAEVKAAFPGRRVSWDAGHTGNEAQPLAAECTPCNRSEGGRRGALVANAARGVSPDLNPSRRWY